MITNNLSIAFSFDCESERGVTYFLEPLLLISIFGKQELSVKLQGATNHAIDPSIDCFINGLIPLIKNKFNFEKNPFLISILRRGCRGEGEIKVEVQIIKQISSTVNTLKGKIRKITGVAYCGKVSSQFLGRMINTVKEVLNNLFYDIYIKTEFIKKSENNMFGITLTAETTTGNILSVDENYNSLTDSVDPEALGKKCALHLVDEIMYSGCIDSNFQGFVLCLMSLSERKVSEVKMGRLTGLSIDIMRIIYAFTKNKFKCKDDTNDEFNSNNTNAESEKEDMDSYDLSNSSDYVEEDEEIVNKEQTGKPEFNYILVSCLGSGISNMSIQNN